MLAFHRARFPFFLPLGLVLGAMALPSSAQTPAGVDAGWSAEAGAQLRRAEYHFSALEAGRFGAPNRAQDMRLSIGSDGLEVVPRSPSSSAEGEPWHLRLRTKTFGRMGDPIELGAALVSANENRLELDHGQLSEWFVNEERGLEQGWTIASAPSGVEPLWIGLELAGDLGLRIDDSARSGVLVDAAGVLRLRYTGLMAFDATGRELEARLAPSPEGVGISIDDAGAVYPLTVDPVLTGPAWTAESDQASAWFGWSVAAAGDVNGDGYSDVIVGARIHDNGQSSEGRAFVYLGSGAGLSTSPVWTAESDQAIALFGNSVGSAGDVNGDGYGDVIVGALQYDNGQTDEGRAYVYLGSIAGLSASPAWTAESDQAFANFGVSVATAGDVNGDGYGDVIVGTNQYDNGQTSEGRACVYLGSAAGLLTSPAWVVEGDQDGAQLGISVAAAGDVDGDGFDDVIVGAFGYDNGQTDEGRAFVYLGSGAGLATSAAWTAESDQASAQFGRIVAPGGDVNGDGYGDVIVGAWLYDNGETNEGRAFAFLGSGAGLSASPAWMAESDQAGAFLAWSVASAGDVNGDGYGDVIVGAYVYDNGQTDEGRASLYLGSGTGLSTSSAWTAEGDQAGALFGHSATTAGDVNGDGYSDVVVGAYRYDNGSTDEGRAFVYLGSGAGISTSPAWTAEGERASAYFGFSVATAGDVNGDGYSDVIVGAPYYDNYPLVGPGRAFVYLGSSSGLSTSAAWVQSDQGLFGYSVATAGDVNGDGYSDVIIGAYAYGNGQSNEGRAFVYLGSGTGLSTGAAWTAESNQASAWFGRSVATAGDVNGDGYSDVIVGALLFDNDQTDEGRAFVYLGSRAGLSASAVWTAESNQASTGFDAPYFSGSVATAGDVNGDGYSDVIVGAYAYDNDQSDEGRAFVYLGSGSGLSNSPAWTAESDQEDAWFGWSVATAGDVNGDGHSDVIVGANGYDNGHTNEGRAFVYLGSAAGLSASSAWEAEGDGHFLESFGESVATAGDVNGDGYSDVIVGALDSLVSGGQVFVYAGSGTGLSNSATRLADGTQGSAPEQFGFSVATAGDVNGDGYSDVIVGGPQYDDGQPFQGGASFLYLGNEGRGGRILAPQQRRAVSGRPMAAMGRSDGPGFRIRVEHPGLAGGGLAYLVWEVKPLGVAFDGLGTVSGARLPLDPFSAQSFYEMALPSGDPALPYKWRARVALVGNSFFPSTPWFSIPDNSRTETDLRLLSKPVRPGSRPPSPP